MITIDNITSLLGEDLEQSISPGSRLKIAASCFSIYAYEALKSQLEQIESVEFIFTCQTFVQNEAIDKLPKEKSAFFIPKLERERSLYGSEFEILLRNKLTQRAIARDCADWIQRNRDGGVNTGQLNRLHPFYLVYLGENGGVVTGHTEVKRLLDLARGACRGNAIPVRDLCEAFNRSTRDFELISFLVVQQAIVSEPSSSPDPKG